MNKVILSGRLTADPEIRYTNSKSDGQMAIGRYTLAVDRRFKRQGEADADFLRCVTFGKGGEFAEKYLHKGMKILVTGRIQTGSYEDRDGRKVYTTDILVEDHEFCESKNAGSSAPAARREAPADEGFMSIPDDVEDGGLPFN